MLKQISLDVESFFITNKKIFKVFRIEKRVVGGKKERIIHYRPYYLDDSNKTLVCSIPESNISTLNPCKPIPKLEMFKLLTSLGKKEFSDSDNEVDQESAQSALDSNNIHRIVEALKAHWINNQNNRNTKSMHKDMDDLIKRITEELAFLLDTSRDHARKRIITALNNHEPTLIEF